MSTCIYQSNGHPKFTEELVQLMVKQKFIHILKQHILFKADNLNTGAGAGSLQGRDSTSDVESRRSMRSHTLESASGGSTDPIGSNDSMRTSKTLRTTLSSSKNGNASPRHSAKAKDPAAPGSEALHIGKFERSSTQKITLKKEQPDSNNRSSCSSAAASHSWHGSKKVFIDDLVPQNIMSIIISRIDHLPVGPQFTLKVSARCVN